MRGQAVDRLEHHLLPLGDGHVSVSLICADTCPGGGRVSRSAAVIGCTERTTRADSWAVGWREAGARGFDATRIVFMRRVAPNLRAASRRDPTGARRAARILDKRGVSPAAERDTLPLPGLHRTSDAAIKARREAVRWQRRSRLPTCPRC